MRVAYLVISHRSPGQVLRLARALREQPGAEVFVRHDQRRIRLTREDAEGAGARLIEDATEVEWGDFSFLEVLLRGLRTVAEAADPDWAIVLSGQDYPLGHHSELEAFLESTGRDAHLPGLWPVESLRLRGGPQDEFVLRHAYRHFELPWVPRRLPRLLAYRRDLPAPRRPQLGLRRLRTPDVRLHVSGDWPTLSARALRVVLDFAENRPDVVRFLRGGFAPSEAFFSTALTNPRGLSIGTGSHRFVDFAPGAPSPRILTDADLPAMTASGAHFARKFDPAVDAEVLDALDRLRAEGAVRASLGRPWPAETSESP